MNMKSTKISPGEPIKKSVKLYINSAFSCSIRQTFFSSLYCSKLRINVDITVAMKCQREYLTIIMHRKSDLYMLKHVNVFGCRCGSRYSGPGRDHDHI